MAGSLGQRAFQLLQTLHRRFVLAACEAQVAGQEDTLRLSSSSEKTQTSGDQILLGVQLC